MRTWVAGAILGLCCAARADDVLARVEALLGAGIEPVGVHAQIVALGEPAEQALWTLYGDPHKDRIVRLRALSELASFATADTAAGLLQVLRDAPAATDPLARSPLVLKRALDGLLAIASQTKIALSASDLSSLLEHGDAHVRKAAARLLAYVDRGDVEGVLGALVARDPSRMVRMTAQRAQVTRAARLR